MISLIGRISKNDINELTSKTETDSHILRKVLMVTKVEEGVRDEGGGFRIDMYNFYIYNR